MDVLTRPDRRQHDRLAAYKRAAGTALFLAVAILATISRFASGNEPAGKGKAHATATKPRPDPPPVRDSDHRFQHTVRNYIEIREQNIVMQRRDYSCGAACLATLAKYYWGDDVTEDMVLGALDEILTAKEVSDRIKNGLALTDLRRAAVKLGYQSTIGKATLDKLADSRIPVIVGISPEGHDHFVVYRGIYDDWVYVADPIRGNVRMTVPSFTQQWQKNALLVIHKPGAKVRKVSPLSVCIGEIERGELNEQLIRTEVSRLPRTPRVLER